jgi:hypothetical protein
MHASRSFGPLFLSLLATPIFALACGDVVTVEGDGDASTRADARADGNAPDAAPDTDADVPDGPIITFPPCVNGTIADDAKWCCDATSDPNCGASNSGDACLIDCQRVCTAVTGASNDAFSCFRGADSDGGATIQYLCGACGVGRIPEGLAACGEGETVGDRLAFQAYYEAASVFAFEDLAATLHAAARTGAAESSALAARAEKAAREETVHAASMAALATRYGAVAPRPERPLATTREMIELARENAVEGCVRETYGALVAAHQAQFATQADLRLAFAAIADDEASHAALSWDLHTYFCAILGPVVAAELDASREAAFDAFAADAANRSESFTDRVLGIPRGRRAVALVAALRQSLAA